MTSRGPVTDVIELSSVNCSNVTTSDLIDLAPRVTGHSPWSILKNQNLSRDCHHQDCHVTLSRKKKPDLNIHFMVAKRPESRIELRFRETPKSNRSYSVESVWFNSLVHGSVRLTVNRTMQVNFNDVTVLDVPNTVVQKSLIKTTW